MYTYKFRWLWILSVLKPRLYMAWRDKLLAVMAGLRALQLLALLWCAGKYILKGFSGIHYG